MNDTLRYMKNEPIHRSHHQSELSFRMVYAFTENFVLPLSHDEVVHGKRSLLSQMPGDYWQQFANLRLLYGYQYAMPGKKLLFMGGEFGQWTEWNHDEELDWGLFGHKYHDSLRRYVGDWNRLYKTLPALFANDFKADGFAWIQCDDSQNSVFAFERTDSESEHTAVAVCNFTPVPRENYRIGVSQQGYWQELLNSDAAIYGGTNMGNDGGVYTSYDGGKSWRRFTTELPLVQFFNVNYDMAEPFRVYGSIQDHGSRRGVVDFAQSRRRIKAQDWERAPGGEGSHHFIDPRNADIVYSCGFYGGISRTDLSKGRTGRSKINLEAPEGAGKLRGQWLAHFILSPHNPDVLYHGMNYLFRSKNQGKDIEIISPDLTRALVYENPMNDFGTIRVIAESPLREGVMAVGTDDGLAKYPYVRESRRIRACFTVLEEHVGVEQRGSISGKSGDELKATTFGDSVGVGSYGIDLHPSTGGDNYIDFAALPFQVPLGALLPRRVQNLVAASKNIGVTHITGGCYRMHPVEWGIGEAAGCLIAYSLANRLKPQAIHQSARRLEAFQKMLQTQGVEISWS